MEVVNDTIKEKIKTYEIAYPTYYDLVVYVMQLENEIKELRRKENERTKI